MSLFDTVSTSLVAAMKARDSERLRALQNIKAALLLLKTEKGRTTDPSEEEMIKAIQKLAKQRKEGIELFGAQNRQDLVEREKNELKVLEEFLPQMMSEAEITTVLQRIIAETGAKSMAEVGKVMPLAMKETAGKADGKLVSELLKKLLG